MYPHNAMWIHNSHTSHTNGQHHTLTQVVQRDDQEPSEFRVGMKNAGIRLTIVEPQVFPLVTQLPGGHFLDCRLSIWPQLQKFLSNICPGRSV